VLEKLISAWQATSNLEIVSVVFGLAYVILAARTGHQFMAAIAAYFLLFRHWLTMSIQRLSA